MSDKEWPKHLYSLDVSRGIASLSVILWHWQHFAYKGYFKPHDFVREKQPVYEVLRLFYEKGSMGVSYFFILSGFIFFWLYSTSIKSRKISAWEFSIQRFSRLYPLHFATLLAVAVLQMIYVSREGVPFVYQYNDEFHFFLNLFFASKWGFENGFSFNAPVWSISIEILLYVVFFLTAFFHKGGCLFCLSVSVLSFVFKYFVHHSIFGGVAMFFIGGSVFYAASLILEKYELLKRPVYLTAIFSWFCVIINYYVFNLTDKILEAGMIGKFFLVGFPYYILFPFSICSLTLIEVEKGPFCKSISWVGDITYSTYLLHFPLQLLFGLAVSYGILINNFYVYPAYLIFFFIILIPLSYTVYLKYERPVQRVIRNRMLYFKIR